MDFMRYRKAIPKQSRNLPKFKKNELISNCQHNLLDRFEMFADKHN